MDNQNVAEQDCKRKPDQTGENEQARTSEDLYVEEEHDEADEDITPATRLENEKVEIRSKMESIKYDSSALNELRQELLSDLEKLIEMGDLRRACIFAGCAAEAEHMLKNCEKEMAARLRESPRVEQVWFSVQEQDLIHSFDLNRFVDRVVNLFKWHTKESQRDNFIAPYFALVQSSGMGKTKLLFELRSYILSEEDQPRAKRAHTTSSQVTRKLKDCDCQTILCLNGIDANNQASHNHVFSTEIIIDNNERLDRNLVGDKLSSILKDCKKSKLILLFDEAQHLLAHDGFYFRCVRWWLRIKRNKSQPQVVAVFTGTTSKLTDFYREPAESTTSRSGPSMYYEKGKALYEPFYDICTIGLFASSMSTHSASYSSAQNEYEKAIPHGRPLFALMDKQRLLSTNVLQPILTRMLLGSPYDGGYEGNLEACLSILGTRIQMGQTSMSVSSELVAKGYALLSNLLVSNNDGQHPAVARVFFPPDPVCARLAMCLMDEDWSLGTQVPIQGKSKSFWVKTMSKIFCMGLCMPNQGNLGELGGALYLLFCGDVLRKKQQQGKKLAARVPEGGDLVEGVVDDEYTMFSVPLVDFVCCLLNPNDFYKSDDADDDDDDNFTSMPDEWDYPYVDDTSEDETDQEPNSSKGAGLEGSRTGDVNPIVYKHAEIGFIQVTPNYFRFSITEISQQPFLRGLYQSGCAFYAYHQSHVFDMVGSVRLIDFNGLEHYVPLLVCISTNHQKGLQTKPLQRMRKLLTDAKTFGLCICLMFAFPSQQVQQMKNLLEVADVETLCCGKTVTKKVPVPADDPFGIVKALATTSFGPPESEVYSSHYLCQLVPPRNLPQTLLRSRTKSRVKSYANAMHNALWTKTPP